MSELRDVAEAINAVTIKCANHPDRPSCVNLDGDELCPDCADAWARAEGQWAAEEDERVTGIRGPLPDGAWCY